MPRKRGDYFIANDNYLELAIAFLNSFRSHNPKIPLCLIPFDDNFQQFAPLLQCFHMERCGHFATVR
jgi:hypothetical protein